MPRDETVPGSMWTSGILGVNTTELASTKPFGSLISLLLRTPGGARRQEVMGPASLKSQVVATRPSGFFSLLRLSQASFFLPNLQVCNLTGDRCA